MSFIENSQMMVDFLNPLAATRKVVKVRPLALTWPKIPKIDEDIQEEAPVWVSVSSST